MNTSGYDLCSFDLSNIFRNYDIIGKGAAYELIPQYTLICLIFD